MDENPQLLMRHKKAVSLLKNKINQHSYCDVGLPGGDRTPDPQLRRLLLYPTELRTDR